MKEYKISRIYFIETLLLTFLIGLALGWVCFLTLGNIADNCRVLFIVKEKIITLEKERISLNENKRIDKPKMFLGRIDDAISLTDKLANSLKNKKTKVVFFSSNSGSINGGIDITKQIHDEVIKRLENTVEPKLIGKNDD